MRLLFSVPENSYSSNRQQFVTATLDAKSLDIVRAALSTARMCSKKATSDEAFLVDAGPWAGAQVMTVEDDEFISQRRFAEIKAIDADNLAKKKLLEAAESKTQISQFPDDR